MPALTINIEDLPDAVRSAVQEAVEGKEVVIASAGVPAVRLSPVTSRVAKPRILGLHPGAMVMRDDFDDYIDEEDFLKGEI